MSHSFPRVAKFQAELQNLDIPTEFGGILQKLRNDQWLVQSLAWWRNFIAKNQTELPKVLCPLQIAITI